MKISLVICPYFTRGTSPPLGAGYINAVLKHSSHQVDIFDLQFLLKLENPRFFEMLSHLFFIGNDLSCAQFILNPELTLYYLFPEYYKNNGSRIFKDKRKKALIGVAQIWLEEYRHRFMNLILKKKPKVILFSTYISNLAFTLLLAKTIKSKDPNIPIFFGGPGCALGEVQNLVLDLGFVDGIIAGEGEEVIIEVLERIKKRQSLNCDIPGFLTQHNIKSSFKLAPRIENLDSLSFPDFDGFPSEGYDIKSYEKNYQNEEMFNSFALPIAASRGCLYKCAFCSETNYWNGLKRRSVVSVIEEIKYQKSKYNLNKFIFCDSLLNSDKKWLIEFCERIIKERLDISFWAYLKPVKNLDEFLIGKLKEAGLCSTYLGLETFSQKILNKMGKGIEGNRALSIMQFLNSNGIITQVSLLSGFPFETEEDILENIKFIKKWHRLFRNKGKNDLLQWSANTILRLEPFSYMFNYPDKFNIKIFPHKVQLPSGISHLNQTVSKISFCWNNGITLKEKFRRRGVLKEALRRYNLKQF